ncbi:MAG: 2-oxoacid:acceptor oxidoreductase family protein [Oscillospiraceae bacterium]|nr:2-oxoacid:acceptor oxidoreductase family protein [Oscillospiraceae bacterium]
MTKSMIFAGFGGQGILFTGKMAAYSGMMDGKEVSWLPSYGPEMRGGTANCSVCISDEAIACPLVINPDVLLAMNTPSYEKFIGDVVPGGVAILDSSLISLKSDRSDITVCYVPATALADANGLNGLANMILFGKMLKETGFTSIETLKKSLEKVVPAKKAHLIESNMKAVALGMEQ